MVKTATATVDTSIHSRALLVWLTISTWSARKYDRKISDKVNREYSATSDAGRYNKFLLPGDNASYKALATLASGIRAQHYTHTLAWSDEGYRLLPTDNYMAYTDWFRQQQAEFNRHLDAFAADYPTMRESARSLLNGMYKDEDYPRPSDIRSRFALDVSYSPLPNFGDVRVDLASDQVREIETAIANKIESAIGVAVKDVWSRLYDVVSRIRERLSDKDAIFRDSLINNARELCEILPRLNVTHDPMIATMRDRVLAELTTYDPDVLRDTPRVRAKVAQSADAIMASMAAYYTPDGK